MFLNTRVVVVMDSPMQNSGTTLILLILCIWLYLDPDQSSMDRECLVDHCAKQGGDLNGPLVWPAGFLIAIMEPPHTEHASRNIYNTGDVHYRTVPDFMPCWHGFPEVAGWLLWKAGCWTKWIFSRALAPTEVLISHNNQGAKCHMQRHGTRYCLHVLLVSLPRSSSLRHIDLYH